MAGMACVDLPDRAAVSFFGIRVAGWTLSGFQNGIRVVIAFAVVYFSMHILGSQMK